MASGYHDPKGFWHYGEDDIADPGNGFSDLLNKGTQSVAEAVPYMVQQGVVEQLRSIRDVRGRGALVLHFDDGTRDHATIAAPMVEAAGGFATFALWTQPLANPAGSSTHMSHAEIAALAARGHEIAAHSVTHTRMTDLTAAQRVAEWDDSRSFLEGIVGAGKVRSWVYPYSAANAAIDVESYGRYDRTFSDWNDSAYSIPRTMLGKRIRTGRIAWVQATHARALELVRKACLADETVTLITHNVNGQGAAQGVTQAQLQEMLNLANALGMPIIRSSDASPAYGVIPNAGFEDEVFADEWNAQLAGAGTSVSAVAKGPSTGLPGAKALRLTGIGTGTVFAISRRPILIREAGQHTFSTRMTHDLTQSADGSYIAIREVDALGATIKTTNLPRNGTVGNVPWTQLSLNITPDPNTYGVLLIHAQAASTGQTYFDHSHFAPTRYGVIG